MFVLDASVIIKWFNQEEFTDEALGFRDGFVKGEIKIVAPDLLLYEVSNALRYNKSFKPEDVQQAIDSLYNIGIDIVVPVLNVIKSAVEISYKYDVTVYDSFYVALAKWINFKYITADWKFYQKVKNLDFVKFIGDL